MTKKIIICKDCNELKPHEARGLCQRCYGRWKWHNVVDKEKQRKRRKKYIKEHREEYNIYMRILMRKRLGVKNPTKFTAQELIDGMMIK